MIPTAASGDALSSRARGFVYGCFFLSGATGLVYQGVWFRHLQALFGVTTHALAVVVAAFMGGLAAGSWAFGRVADRTSRPLRLYGWLEIGIGLLALLVAPAVAGIEHLYVALHPHLTGSLLGLSLVRLALSLLALLIPTCLMGGTLPALTVLLRRHSANGGHAASLHGDLGRLYGINTLGAVAGTVAVGFVLLATIGLWRTTLVAALVNIAIGVACVRLDRGAAGAAAPGAKRAVAPAATPTATTSPIPTALWTYAHLAFAISGGVSLAYEVVWTRALSQIIGSSTYAFSMILAAFLLGIGIGSFVLERWRGRDAAGLWGFCAAQLAIGATAALVVPWLIRLPDLQLQAFGHLRGLEGVLLVQFGLCLAAVLLPAIAMGATFPLVAGFVAGNTPEVGRAVGRLYAGNTVGGILGSMLAGFVAIPYLGTQRTLLWALCTNVGLAVVGFGLLLRHTPDDSPRRRQVAAILLLVTLGLVIVALRTPPWDPYQLDAGIAIGGPATVHDDPTLRVRDVGRGSDILEYREGLNANISVRKDETQYYLKTNGKTDGTTRGDMPTQLMLGLLPVLVHPEPRTGLVIGLGTGASARAAATPLELRRLDVVEIEPAIVALAQRHFGLVNHGLFEDPRVHIVVDDARAFLLTTPERYDFIVSEPSNPWIAGVASLFSVEHYERCAARLQPDGILTQWLQIYAMRPELVRMVLASMQTVFPHLAVWWFHHGDLIVLASRAPLPDFDLQQIEARLDSWRARDEVRRVLDVGTAAGLAGFHVLGETDVARFASGATRNTEDRPRLEFEAPRSLYLSTRDSNAQLLLAARQNPLPTFAAGQRLQPADRLELVRAALSARRYADAEAWAQTALADSALPRAAALAWGGTTALELRQPDIAAARLEEALRLDPTSARAAQSLTLLRGLQGRGADTGLLAIATASDPSRTPRQLEGILNLLEMTLQSGRADVVLERAEALLSQPGPTTDDPVLRSRLIGIVARAQLQLRRPVEAERAARQALEMNPQSTAAWRVLGGLAFEAKNWPEAIRWWERLVDYRQTSTEVLLPLAIACQRAGQRDEARLYATRVLRQEPQNGVAKRLLSELH